MRASLIKSKVALRTLLFLLSLWSLFASAGTTAPAVGEPWPCTNCTWDSYASTPPQNSRATLEPKGTAGVKT